MDSLFCAAVVAIFVLLLTVAYIVGALIIAVDNYLSKVRNPYQRLKRVKLTTKK